MLIFYFYFVKEKNHSCHCPQNPERCHQFFPNLFMMLLSSFISLGVFFFLIFWTHKNSYNTIGRIWIYFIFLFSEILYMILSIYVELFYRVANPLKIQIDWKINRIDYTRINFIYLVIELFFEMIKDTRCCHKIIGNYR